MRPQVIAIHGLAGAGKSTSASHFVNQHDCVVSKMAGTLKKMTSDLLTDAGVSQMNIGRYIEGSQRDKLELIPQLAGYHSRDLSHLYKTMTAHVLADAGLSSHDVRRKLFGSERERRVPIENLYGFSAQEFVDGLIAFHDVFFPSDKPVSSRHFMKMIGSEWRDNFNPKLWVDLAILRKNKLIADGIPVVVDDLRFLHEHEALLGAFDDRIMFVKVESADHDAVADADMHQSERPMPDHLFHTILRNNGALLDLYAGLEGALERFDNGEIMERDATSNVVTFPQKRIELAKQAA